MSDDPATEPTSLWDALQKDFLDEAEHRFGRAMDDLNTRRIAGNSLGAPLGYRPVDDQTTAADLVGMNVAFILNDDAGIIAGTVTSAEQHAEGIQLTLSRYGTTHEDLPPVAPVPVVRMRPCCDMDPTLAASPDDYLPVEPNITRAITTSDIPAALRGTRWKP